MRRSREEGCDKQGSEESLDGGKSYMWLNPISWERIHGANFTIVSWVNFMSYWDVCVRNK